jgi:hypothetical protein
MWQDVSDVNMGSGCRDSIEKERSKINLQSEVTKKPPLNVLRKDDRVFSIPKHYVMKTYMGVGVN